MFQPRTDETIFAAALEFVDLSDREAYLERACDGQPELRVKVDELLVAHQGSNPLLDSQTHGRQFGIDTDRGAELQVRCPHCRVPVSVQSDAELKSVRCESCSTEFSLVSEDGYDKPNGITKIGHFQLIERVGMGSFGTVWRANDTKLDRIVAVKIPRKGLFSRDQQRDFLREAQHAAQLNHAGIVTVHEVGRENDTLYIVSDFVHGVTLAEWLESGRPTIREATELALKIAAALQHAHQRNVVHRDLKPGNIMLSETLEPHLMDFGLAKRDAEDVTVSLAGHLLGTPAYMSPEQAKGEAHLAGPQSDIYSLGVILFQLLTGELPFRGSMRVLLDQVLHQPAPSPRTLNGSVSRDLETITLKCLQKNPERRYQSAEEVFSELERVLHGKPIIARPVTSVERSLRWMNRHRSITALCSTIALLLLAGGPTIVWLRQSAILVEEKNRHLAEINGVVGRNKYHDSISTAAQAIESEDSRPTRRILAATDPKYRDWEWLHLRCRAQQWSEQYEQVIASSGDRFLRATDEIRRKVAIFDRALRRDVFVHEFPLPVESAVLNSQGTLVAIQQGSKAQVWDIASGAKIAATDGTRVQSLRYWPAEFIVVLEPPVENSCTIWHPSSGKRFRCESPGMHAALAYSEGYVALGGAIRPSGDGGVVTVWDAHTGQKLGETISEHECRGLQIANDIPHLVFHTDAQQLEFWDIRSGEFAKFHETSVDEAINWTGISPRNCMFGATVDHSVRVWTTDNLKELPPFARAPTRDLAGPAFSPDGRTVVAVAQEDDCQIFVWDRESGDLIRQLYGNNSWSAPPRFISDHEFVIAKGSTSRLWDLRDPPPVVVLDSLENAVVDLDYSSSGDRITAINKVGRVQVWNTEDGTLKVQPQTEWRPAASLLPATAANNAFARTLRQVCTLWDRYVGEYALWIGNQTETGWAVQFANHDQWILARTDRAVFTRPVAGVPCIHWRPFYGPYKYPYIPRKIEVGPDGNSLFLGAQDRAGFPLLQEWDIQSCKLLHSWLPHGEANDAITDLALSSSGEYLASCASFDRHHVSVWDRQTHQRIAHLQGHDKAVVRVDFHPDGNRLASASEDQTARIWDVSTGSSLATLEHPGSVWALAFHPDGARLATGDDLGTIRIWDLVNYQMILELKEHKGRINRLQFSPDGRQLASASNDGTVRLWNSLSNAERHSQ